MLRLWKYDLAALYKAIIVIIIIIIMLRQRFIVEPLLGHCCLLLRTKQQIHNESTIRAHWNKKLSMQQYDRLKTHFCF